MTEVRDSKVSATLKPHVLAKTRNISKSIADYYRQWVRSDPFNSRNISLCDIDGKMRNMNLIGRMQSKLIYSKWTAIATLFFHLVKLKSINEYEDNFKIYRNGLKTIRSTRSKK